MNDMTITNSIQATMSSLELVEFINSEREEEKPKLRHDHFMAKVPKVLGSSAPEFLGTDSYQANGIAHTRNVYNFPKREACLMAMSYSYDLQAKVYDRMTHLEEQSVKPDPLQALNDPATMRELLLGYSEKVLALESTVQEQAPKVAAFDRLSTSDGSLCLTDTAKHLQERPKDLMQWLQANTWIYRRAGAGKWLGYQHRIQQGLLEHKVTTVSRSDGSEKICEQVRVTPKGLSRLAEIFQPTMA